MSKTRVNPSYSAVPSSGFADRLRSLRKKRGVPQRVLADMAGVSPIQYSRYERGVSLPNAEGLKRLADVLEVSGDFLGGETEAESQARVEDRELARMIADVQALPAKDKEVIKIFLDAFLVKRKVQALASDPR